MLRRPIAAALLPLLLCTGPAGQAAEGRGATVVLRLPPSMSPAEVKGLIADLAAKGAQPSTAEPAPPAPAASPPLTTAIFAAQVWAATGQALRAIPVLRQAPQVWNQEVEADGGTAGALSASGWLRSSV